MKNLLATIIFIFSVQPLFAEEIDCISEHVIQEAWGMNTIASTLVLKSVFINDFNKPVTSVSWIAENTTGKKVAVANSMFHSVFGLPKPLEANKSSEIEYSTVIRSQQLGLKPVTDEDERETIRDNLENRVKKELPKYEDLVCRIVRVNFKDGTNQKF
tara:strand:+ start:143 stop:616 length:474 start_codon:yes stop_codon:yes gene_type:complete